MPSKVVAPLDTPTPGGGPPGIELTRAGGGSGSVGVVGEDVCEVQPQAPTPTKVWTVDGWAEGDATKRKAHLTKRQSTHSKINNFITSNSNKTISSSGSNSSSSETDSYSGDSSSPGDTTSSAGSIGCGQGWVRSENSSEGGCCSCMCLGSRIPTTTASVKIEMDHSVMPGRRPMTTTTHQTHRARFWNAIILKEDNARFLLLALVLLMYMVMGALVFTAMEEDNERREREDYIERYNSTLTKLKEDIGNRNVTLARVEELLYVWGNMTDDGYKLHGRPLWDFAGSFHFVYTVVSTIGYGAASPRTKGGKIFCIFYGLLGCSSGILFFNLFLERIITLLAFIMRSRHERKIRRQVAAAAAGAEGGVVVNSHQQRRSSQDSLEDSSLDAWKPSVYWVMFYLSIASCIVAFTGAVMFMEIEEWTYADSIYFSFVSFATIGFGDFVSAQQPNGFYGTGLHAYRFFNFFILVLGCCCIYSLFNVISITIKQFLNWLIKRTATCCAGGHCRNSPHGNTVSPSRTHKHTIKRIDGDIDSMYGSETERKLSGEMVSMREYISTNKVSLAVMQKQLYETAQLGRGSSAPYQRRPSHEERFTPGQVGPLAIASSKLCGDGRS